MASIGWYVKSIAIGLGGLGVLVAWDRFDRGPGVADDPAGDAGGDCGLYSWTGFTVGSHFVSAKSKYPVQIQDSGCPVWLGDPAHDYVLRFLVDNQSTGLGAFVNFSFALLDGKHQVYTGAADGQPLLMELADGSFGLDTASVLDRFTYQGFGDTLSGPAYLIQPGKPANEIWRALVTPGAALDLFE